MRQSLISGDEPKREKGEPNSLKSVFAEQGQDKPFVCKLNLQSDDETITFQLPPYLKALIKAASPEYGDSMLGTLQNRKKDFRGYKKHSYDQEENTLAVTFHGHQHTTKLLSGDNSIIVSLERFLLDESAPERAVQSKKYGCDLS